MQIYYIDKVHGTFADELLAIGFGSVLSHLCLKLVDNQDGITIHNRGSCYTITSKHVLDLDLLAEDALTALQICQPLASKRQQEKMAKKKGGDYKLDGFDYDAKMEHSQRYRAWRKELGLNYPDAVFEQRQKLEEMNEPDPRLSHYQAINAMKIANTFNTLTERWGDLSEPLKRAHLALLCEYFSQPYQDETELIAKWQQIMEQHGRKEKPMVTALQIINPTAGKGANKTKASALSIGNLESFWLLELLKFRGYMEGAAPLVVDNGDDRKTYVIQPHEIQISALQSMMKTFRAVLWSTTAVKLDILASLRFAQVFVNQHKRCLEPTRRLAFLPPRLPSIAQGFDVAYYQWLGSAHATMNVATIGIPVWLPSLETLELVTQADELLKEHIQIINHLRTAKGDEGAEEYELLRFYRDFLSSNELKSFWQFAARYGTYLLHQREQEKNVQRHMKQLSYKGMEIIVQNTNLTEITNNASFKRIAAAIRGATLQPQRRKAQGQEPIYDIRYGLGQKLRRSAPHKHEFLITLSEFLQSYVEENERERERAAKSPAKKPLYQRVSVSMEDLHAISDLIERFESSELIGTMLAACGYMWETSQPTTKSDPDNDINQNH